MYVDVVFFKGSICINTILSWFLFVLFVCVDCLTVIAPVEEVPVSQGTVNDRTPAVVISDPPTMNTLPQQSSVTGSNLPTPASTGMYVCVAFNPYHMYVCVYICDQICEKGLIHASDFVTLKRHNFINFLNQACASHRLARKLIRCRRLYVYMCVHLQGY